MAGYAAFVKKGKLHFAAGKNLLKKVKKSVDICFFMEYTIQAVARKHFTKSEKYIIN